MTSCRCMVGPNVRCGREVTHLVTWPGCESAAFCDVCTSLAMDLFACQDEVTGGSVVDLRRFPARVRELLMEGA